MIYSLIAAIVVVLCLAFLLLREHRISLSIREKEENLEHEGYRWQVECQHLQRALEEAKQKNQDQAKELQLQFKEIATQIVEERSKT